MSNTTDRTVLDTGISTQEEDQNTNCSHALDISLTPPTPTQTNDVCDVMDRMSELSHYETSVESQRPHLERSDSPLNIETSTRFFLDSNTTGNAALQSNAIVIPPRQRHKTDSPLFTGGGSKFPFDNTLSSSLDSCSQRGRAASTSGASIEEFDDIDGGCDSDGPGEKFRKKKFSAGSSTLTKSIQAFGSKLLRGSFKKSSKKPDKMTKSPSANPISSRDQNHNLPTLPHSHTTTELKENTDIGNPKKMILSYPARVMGVILLITNFTADLKGYLKDRENLFNFFVKKLGYVIVDKMDCTREQLFEGVQEAVDKVKELNANRLIVAILTHGEEKGIHTVEKDGNFLREVDADNKEIVTEIEELITLIKHDKLPELQGQPKLVFIQSCSGDEVVKAAGGKASNFNVDQADSDSFDEREEDFIVFQKTLPVDTDIFVATAATKYNKSFVLDHEGSWFIRTMLEVFENLYKTTDVERMMKSVTLLVSEMRKKHTLENNTNVVAKQVPARQSTLRMDCYL